MREELLTVMDFKKMAEEIGLEHDEFLELLDLYVSTGRHDLAKLREAFETKHFLSVAEAAHSLTGASSNLGFAEIAEIARGVELNAREGILGTAVAAISHIEEGLRAIADSLEQHVKMGGA